MIDKILGGHSENLERAMSQATKRQELLAANIANVNTPGYRRRDIEFGIELDMAGERRTLTPNPSPSDGRGGFTLTPRLSRSEGSGGFALTPNPSPSEGRGGSYTGGPVNMEQEAAAIAETELRFLALAEMTSRYFAGLKKVIREGR